MKEDAPARNHAFRDRAVWEQPFLWMRRSQEGYFREKHRSFVVQSQVSAKAPSPPADSDCAGRTTWLHLRSVDRLEAAWKTGRHAFARVRGLAPRGQCGK